MPPPPKNLDGGPMYHLAPQNFNNIYYEIAFKLSKFLACGRLKRYFLPIIWQIPFIHSHVYPFFILMYTSYVVLFTSAILNWWRGLKFALPVGFFLTVQKLGNFSIIVILKGQMGQGAMAVSNIWIEGLMYHLPLLSLSTTTIWKLLLSYLTCAKF